ncbi:MAG: hypothetical protein HN945_03050 [Deltaproteobacteria bacterium]|jgi:replicative DNA helicase|nr:hypothetical protein [Deltaproteobacteria bacterium]MBT4262589.1 hypothetical protein [Deltaproteobacteria bacterium]MBT4640591.1 hypothetical protein [Deltaproteobacteria bacterium]MBT7151413.1 hypothetical protein [Deltaproteobacteria bacterium]
MNPKQTLSIPHDIEAEQAILEAIIEDNDMLVDVIRILKPETFYKPANQHVYRAMIELDALKNPMDEITIGEGMDTRQLKALMKEKVAELERHIDENRNNSQ